jgi:hypothetical protein
VAALVACLLIAALSPGLPAGQPDLYRPEEGRPQGNTEWYFAEGSTRAGFEEWLLLFNPGPDDALVEVEYMVERGINRTRYYPLAARSRLNVYVNQEVGSGHDLGLKATSDRFFLAERAMYFNYEGSWRGGYSYPGVNSPSNEWYFAEAGAGPLRDCWLSLLNPGDQECRAEVFFVRDGGENIALPIALPERRRVTVNVNELAEPWSDFFIMVMSDEPIVAERAEFFSYQDAWAGGFATAGATSPSEDLCFASLGALPDRDTWLVLANPGVADAEVKVKSVFAPDDQVESVLFLPGLSRQAFSLSQLTGREGECSVRLASDRPIVGEATAYFSIDPERTGGACIPGSAYTASRWYLAGGSTLSDFQGWLELACFDDEPARVALYVYSGGETKLHNLAVEPLSRVCLPLDQLGPADSDISCEIVSDRDILVQQSTYFLYHGLWGGGDAETAWPAP